MEIIDYLFCYGTLKEARVWSGVTGLEPRMLSDRAVLKGWVAKVGPWGFMEAEPAGEEDAIVGMVRPVPDMITWLRLNYFEGPGYDRVPVDVDVGDGKTVRAAIYARTGSSDKAMAF